MPRCAPTPSSSPRKTLERNAKNLDYFDALVFVSTTGELDLDDSQKKDMLVVHQGRRQGICRSSRRARHELQMAGIRRDDRRLVRPASVDRPSMRRSSTKTRIFPRSATFPRHSSSMTRFISPRSGRATRSTSCSVSIPSKLNYANNPRVHRTDHDFAVAWDKMYGKGRVFYSTLGHTRGGVERPRHPQDVFRSDQVGAGHDGRQHGFSSAGRRSSRGRALNRCDDFSAYEVPYVRPLVLRSR